MSSLFRALHVVFVPSMNADRPTFFFLSSERLRISPFGSSSNPSPQYVLSNSPPRTAKRPSRDRSQTVSGSGSLNGSSSLFGSAYSLSNSSTKEREAENVDSFEDLPTSLPSRSIGRRSDLPAFNSSRRPSLPISMSTYTTPSGTKPKLNSTRLDPESEDEREEQSSRLLFFAAQRAELPKPVQDLPPLSSPMTRSKSSERPTTPEDPLAASSKKKFKWNAAFGGGKAKTQV